MKTTKKLIATAYFTLCLTLMLNTSVSAYIDPATTTYLIQIIAGVFIAGGALIGVFRHKIKRLFTKNKNTQQENNKEKKNVSNTDDMFD